MKSTILLLPAVLALSACDQPWGPHGPGPGPAPHVMVVPQTVHVERGRIIAVRPVTMRRTSDGDQIVGAVAGGLVGAVIGNQFGAGSGKDLMTGAGAVTGAIIGSNIAAQRAGTYTSYAWTVRLDNGGTVTIIQLSHSFRVGQRVRVVSRGDQMYLE